jgi:translation initiation factor 2-alpha kinase 4
LFETIISFLFFRGGKKVDIYRLGVVALSLAQGEIVHDVYIPKSLPADFANFLKRCLDKDERERWSADQV